MAIASGVPSALRASHPPPSPTLDPADPPPPPPPLPVPPRRTWERRSAARPGEIKRAALHLFAERGYAATTIEDIALAAAVTVGTVYRYFDDKAALLAALIDLAIATPLGPSDAPGSLGDALTAIGAASRAAPHAEVLRILVAEGGNFPELVTRYRERVLEPLALRLARELDPGPEGVLRARALLAHVLGAGLIAGRPPFVPALLPQLAGVDFALGWMSPARSPAPLPSPASPRPAPDAW
jgi:AcrR family transcriptional regulator